MPALALLAALLALPAGRAPAQGGGAVICEHGERWVVERSGAERQGAHLSGGGVRLEDGQFATGAVCFGGARRDPIAAPRLR